MAKVSDCTRIAYRTARANYIQTCIENYFTPGLDDVWEQDFEECATEYDYLERIKVFLINIDEIKRIRKRETI